MNCNTTAHSPKLIPARKPGGNRFAFFPVGMIEFPGKIGKHFGYYFAPVHFSFPLFPVEDDGGKKKQKRDGKK